MKTLQMIYNLLLFPLLFLRNTMSKKFIVTLLGGLLLIPSLSFAGGGGGGGGGKGGAGCTAGEAGCPIELVLDGDKENDKHPEEYYYFLVTKAQDVSVNITDHRKTNKDLTIELYPLNDDGSCNTTNAALDTKTEKLSSFSLLYTADGGTAYCIRMDGYEGGMMSSPDQYDIDVTGTADLEVGISDASEREDNGPMEFAIALTKASNSDISIDYTFADVSAINGTNYTGTNGSVTISAGDLHTTLSVPLTDTNMTTSKTFTVTITSTDVDVDEDDETATGKIIGSDSEDADSSYEGPDICYDGRDTSGFCMFGSCMFYQETTHVRAMVDDLEDIDIKKALTRGIAFMNFMDGLGIDDTSKTPATGDDQGEERAFADNTDFMPTSYYFASMFPKGYDYRLGDGADATNGGDMDKDDTTSYYDKALFKLGLFTQYTHIVTYTKHGVTYQEVLQPCNPDEYGALDEAPVLNECGIFMGALNSASKINFTATHEQNISYQDNLITPSIDGSTGYCSQIGSTCPDDGIGSNHMTLPTFRSSEVSTTIDIPYSIVISDQHVGNLQTTTDDNTADPEDNRTMVFEAPYSGTYGKRVMFIKSITDHDDHADHYRYIFKEGDYWIENWDISGSKNVTIEIVGDVRFFIKESFTVQTTTNGKLRIGYEPDNEGSGSCSDPHFYMYLYDNLTLNASGLTYIQNGYIYSNGAITLGGNSTFGTNNTAITSDGVLTVNPAGTGTYNAGNGTVCKDSDTDTSGQFEACPADASAYETGPFDAWDTFRDVDNRHISTKIANEEFNLTIASLNSDDNATEAVEGKECLYRLYDKRSHKVLTDWETLSNEASTTASYADGVDGAYRQAYVQFKFCQLKESYPVILGTFDDCENNATSYEYNSTTESSNGFAIRPKTFALTGPTTGLKSGLTYDFTLQANDKDDNAVADYNQTKDALEDLNDNKTLLFKDNSEDDPENPELNGTLSYDDSTDFNISDGISVDSAGDNDVVGISFNDVGQVKIRVQDSNWASIDSDDTPQSCDKGIVDGTEVEGAFICGDLTTTFIPHHFNVSDVHLKNHNNGSITYISSDLNMSTHIDVKIEAQNAQGTNTLNFRTGDKFYENPVKVDLIAPDKDSAGVALTDILGVSLSVKKHTVAASNLGFENGSHSIAWDTSNKAQQLMFNYNKTTSTPVNPFVINGSDLNVSVSSTYDADDITGYTLGDNTATLQYARAKATKDLYTTSAGSITTPIKVEVYCDKWPASANCPNVDTSHVTNNHKWFISTAHKMSAQDGNISLFTGAIDPSSGTATVTSTVAIESNGIDHAITVTNTSNTSPLRVSIDLNTAITNSWLVYNPSSLTSAPTPFYKVHFTGTMDWAGHGTTGNVVDDNTSTQGTQRLGW